MSMSEIESLIEESVSVVLDANLGVHEKLSLIRSLYEFQKKFDIQFLDMPKPYLR